MPRPLRVLFVEDHAPDLALMLQELFIAGFSPNMHCVHTEKDYAASLSPKIDVILAASLPHFTARRGFELLQASGLDIPYIVIASASWNEKAPAMVHAGAAEYVPKDRMARLGPAVAQALSRKRLERHPSQSQAYCVPLRSILYAFLAGWQSTEESASFSKSRFDPDAAAMSLDNTQAGRQGKARVGMGFPHVWPLKDDKAAIES